MKIKMENAMLISGGCILLFWPTRCLLTVVHIVETCDLRFFKMRVTFGGPQNPCGRPYFELFCGN